MPRNRLIPLLIVRGGLPQMQLDRIEHGEADVCLTCSGPESSRLRSFGHPMGWCWESKDNLIPGL